MVAECGGAGQIGAVNGKNAAKLARATGGGILGHKLREAVMKALISASVAIGLACLGTAARADISTAVRAEGCCMIIAIDGMSGVVTAENKTTARQFQFRAVDAHTLQRLYVGESVDVDPNGQVRAADALKH